MAAVDEEDVVEVALPEDLDPVQGIGPDRAPSALGESVRVW
jgi:hypothetical protein